MESNGPRFFCPWLICLTIILFLQFCGLSVSVAPNVIFFRACQECSSRAEDVWRLAEAGGGERSGTPHWEKCSISARHGLKKLLLISVAFLSLKILWKKETFKKNNNQFNVLPNHQVFFEKKTLVFFLGGGVSEHPTA